MELDEILDRCRRGDEVAWEALVRSHQGRVLALCHHYLRDREDARDATQETFVRIYEAIGSFRGDGGGFAAWVVRIARNHCIDRIRRGAVRREADAGRQPEAVSPEPGPEASTLTRERRHLLYRALDRMTAINREMILLRDIQGLKQRDIAELLAIPLGTVKTRSMRARLELAERVVELDPSYGTGT